MDDYCNRCGAETEDLHLEENGQHTCQHCLKREEKELLDELEFIRKVRARIGRRRKKRGLPRLHGEASRRPSRIQSRL
jgi:hypothetical protein